jgi:hypothetical protein
MGDAGTPAGTRTNAHEAMVTRLEAFATRVRAERVDRGSTERDRLGGDTFIRIVLERYLRATFEWLLPKVLLEERDLRRLREAPPGKMGAGTLASWLSKQLATPATRGLPEVEPLFPELKRERIIGQVIEFLTELMHGRRHDCLPNEQIAELARLCDRLLARFPTATWVLSAGERLEDATVLAALSRVDGAEFYRARRADGSRTTVIVSAASPEDHALDSTIAASAAIPRLASFERVGRIRGRTWARTRDELVCSVSDVIAERGPGPSTTRWALETVERLFQPLSEAPAMVASASDVICFQRSDDGLEHPMLLPQALFAPKSRVPVGDSITTLVGLAITGDAPRPDQWAARIVEPAIREWAQSLLGQQRVSDVAVANTRRLLQQARRPPSVAPAGSSLLGVFVRPPESVDRRRNIALYAGGAMAAAGIVAIVVVASNQRARDAREDAITRRQIPPPRFGSTDEETPAQLLERWDRSVRGEEPDAFQAMYTTPASIHGSLFGASTDVPRSLRETWDRRRADGGSFRSGPRSVVEEPPQPMRGQLREACVDSANPTARVRRFSAQAEWFEPTPSRHVPCNRLSGEYVWRVRVTPHGYRICQEGWSIDNAICPSCPGAQVCAGR